ncbi:MAG: hypothetical protein ABI880_13240 [Acidobacteriota bacterium]
MSKLALLTVFSSATFLGYGLWCLTSLSMEREFTRFGLTNLRVLTGSLEVLGGVGLLVGLKWPPALWLSSGGLALLMLCGVGVRVSVGDGLVQTLPALALMLLNLYVLAAATS